jgi:NitT/TauT family transport system substrate-binding protein
LVVVSEERSRSESPLGWSRRLLLGAPASIWAASLIGAQDRPERFALRVAVGGKATMHHLPLTVAEQLGYFKAEGLDVRLHEYEGSSQAEQALLHGKADVAVGGFEHAVRLRARRIDCRTFVCLGRAPQTVLGVSVRAMPDYRHIGYLKGRRIGVSSTGSSTHWFASTMLARGGVEPSKVEFVGLGTTMSAVIAVREGRVDALSSIDPLISILEARGELRVLADTRSLRGTHAALGGPMPGRCLYALREFVTRHPHTVQALTNAVVRALKWLQTAGANDIVRVIPEAHMYGDRTVYMAALDKAREAFSPDGLISEEGALTALKVIAREGVPKGPDTWTNDFAYRARRRYPVWMTPDSGARK